MKTQSDHPLFIYKSQHAESDQKVHLPQHPVPGSGQKQILRETCQIMANTRNGCFPEFTLGTQGSATQGLLASACLTSKEILTLKHLRVQCKSKVHTASYHFSYCYSQLQQICVAPVYTKDSCSHIQKCCSEPPPIESVILKQVQCTMHSVNSSRCAQSI